MTPGPFEVRITRRAEKDIRKLTPQLKRKLSEILTTVIAQDPYQGKKLIGDVSGSYSYRLTYFVTCAHECVCGHIKFFLELVFGEFPNFTDIMGAC